MKCPNICSPISQFDKSDVFFRESGSNDAKRYDILYAVDPLSAQILDRSIARTMPISSWTLRVKTDNPRIPWFPQKIYNYTNLMSSSNTKNNYKEMLGTIWRYGNYEITLDISTSGTSISSYQPFIQYLNVREFEPFANFFALSAQTVPFNFSSNGDSISSQLIDIDDVPNAYDFDLNNNCFNVISGYAPNLTIWFQDTSDAHTFPISSYHWDFGDLYNEGPDDIMHVDSNYYTITTANIVNGTFITPCWRTNIQNHIAKHTYIMPGTYNVSLSTKTFFTNTANICSQYLDAESRYLVYVEEILPKEGDGIYGSISPISGFTNTSLTISGESPLTAYFIASSIIPGSFPFYKIDWDFGDNKTETVSRILIENNTSQGLPFINISAFEYDLNDPRNILVPHIFTNEENIPKTFNIQITGYSCNTNSKISSKIDNMVSITSSVHSDEEVEEKKRLIGSRIDKEGNIVYLFEGESDNTTYTIILTGGAYV